MAFRWAPARTRYYRPILPVAMLLVGAVIVPAPGRTQESSAPPAESTDAPKPDANQSAPAPAEPSAPAAPAPAAPTPAAPTPSSVRIPEVVVTPPKPKRASQAPRPRAIAATRPPAAAVVQPATPPPSPSAAAAAPAAGLAESRPAPGALPKPPGQTITTVSGERIKDAPAFTVEELLQESPGVSFKQGNGPRDIGISIRGSNARNGFGIRNIVVLEDGFSVRRGGRRGGDARAAGRRLGPRGGRPAGCGLCASRRPPRGSRSGDRDFRQRFGYLAPGGPRRDQLCRKRQCA